MPEGTFEPLTGNSTPDTPAPSFGDSGPVTTGPTQAAMVDIQTPSWTDVRAATRAVTLPGLPADVATRITDKMQADVATAKLMGLPWEAVSAVGADRISQDQWPGQPSDNPSILKRITNTIDSANMNRERAQIGARMALGTQSPQDEARLKEINSTLPSPDEQLKAVPKFLLDLAYSTVFQTARQAVIGQLNTKDPAGKVATSAVLSFIGNIPILGLPIQGGRIVRDITEQAAGNAYLASTEAGLDRNRALGVTIALTALNTAVNAVPAARGASAATGLVDRIVTQAVQRSLASGILVKAVTAAGEQALYGYGFAAADALAPEIAKAIGDSGLPQKDVLTLLKQIGIQGTLSTGGNLLLAGAIAGPSIYHAVKGGALDIAVQEQARKIQEPTVTPETATPAPAKPVPPAPGLKNVAQILRMSEADAVALDKATTSAEGSADYINGEQSAKDAVAAYRTTLEANATAKKLLGDIASIDTAQMRPELAAPVDAIMKDFTLSNFSKKTVAKLEALKTSLEADPYMDLPAETLARLGELDKTPLKSLSVDDLQTVRDAAMHYWTLQKEAQRLMVEGRAQAKDAVVGQIQKEMKPAPETPDSIKAVAGVKQKIRDTLSNIADTVGKKAERIGLVAEKVSKTLRNAFYEPLMQGYRDKLAWNDNFNNTFAQKIQTVKDSVGDTGKWLTAPESLKLNDTQTVEADRATRLALYMQSLNEDNRRHVLDGGVGFRFAGKSLRDVAFKVSEGALSDIVKSVESNPQELAFVNAVKEMLAYSGKEQARVYLEQNGIPLKLVDNYYHADVMPVGRGLDVQREAITTQAKKEVYGIGQSKGQLKPRTESSLPIYLNPITFDLAVSRDHAAAYVNLEAPLRQAGRILGDKTLTDAMRKSTGSGKTRQILVKAAKDLAGQSETMTDFEMTQSRFRNKMATAYMAFPNLFVPLKQPAAWLRYGIYVKPKYLLEGAARSIMHPGETERTMRANSALYNNRSTTGRSREVSDVLRAGMPGSELGGKKNITQKLMAPIGWFDTRGSVRPGMQGAVFQALDELAGAQKGEAISPDLMKATGLTAETAKALSPDAQVANAYKFADWVTEQTQTSSNPLLQSDIQRGSPAQQAYSLFMSEGFVSMNIRRQAFFEARTQGTPQAWARYSNVLLITLVTEPLWNTAINQLRRAFNGQANPDIKKEAVAQVVNQLFSGVPILNQVSQQIINKVVMGWQTQSNSMTPIDTAANAVTNVINLSLDSKSYKSPKKAAQLAHAVAEAVSILSGFPVSSTVRTLEGASNIYRRIEAK